MLLRWRLGEGGGLGGPVKDPIPSKGISWEEGAGVEAETPIILEVARGVATCDHVILLPVTLLSLPHRKTLVFYVLGLQENRENHSLACQLPSHVRHSPEKTIQSGSGDPRFHLIWGSVGAGVKVMD